MKRHAHKNGYGFFRLALMLAALAAFIVLASGMTGPAHAQNAPQDPGQPAAPQAPMKKMNKDLVKGDPGFWSYAFSTLIIRFFGIFIVLGILQIFMQVSSRIYRMIEEKAKSKHKASPGKS